MGRIMRRHRPAGRTRGRAGRSGRRPVRSIGSGGFGAWFESGFGARFGPAKWLALTVLGAAAVALTAADAARRAPAAAGRSRVDGRTAAIWLALLGLVVVAAARGVDGRSAWLGTPERHLGVVTWVL